MRCRGLPWVSDPAARWLACGWSWWRRASWQVKLEDRRSLRSGKPSVPRVIAVTVPVTTVFRYVTPDG
jgi:hypothetical protein